ncbi:hypothetical protein P4901_22650 [Escherichia coli]
MIQRYADSDLVTVIQQIQEDFNDFNLLNVNKSDLLEENPRPAEHTGKHR